MTTQGTQRSGLIPKTITDINGHTKVVWVRPEAESKTTEPSLADLKPVLKQRLTEGMNSIKMGEKEYSLKHTRDEKERSIERGYGTPRLREAAENKFEAEFGVKIQDAPPVVLDDEQLYDFIARGLTVEQSHEFARFGVEPHLTHPKLDAEYAYVAGPKVAKIDLKNQLNEDSSTRKAELLDIKKTARSLQNLGVSPHVAAQCLANGLRMEHLKDKNNEIKDIVDMSAKNHVSSEKFKGFRERSTVAGNPGSRGKTLGTKLKAYMFRSLKYWARRQARRVYNRVQRRVSRMLRKVFWPYR